MRIRSDRFNIIFLVVVALAGLIGCKSPESKKEIELTTLRVHVQASADAADSADVVPVFRENPVLIKIERAPFLSEANVTSAEVVEVMGGFAIRVQFERRGMWLLEQYTTLNKGRHFAIFSQFGTTTAQSRWLAAPRISQRIADGVLVFTPDATRDEADRIVRGLNNAVREAKEKSLFKDNGL